MTHKTFHMWEMFKLGPVGTFKSEQIWCRQRTTAAHDGKATFVRTLERFHKIFFF